MENDVAESNLPLADLVVATPNIQARCVDVSRVF
jgi:hypothetical protein